MMGLKAMQLWYRFFGKSDSFSPLKLEERGAPFWQDE
jgi:hypothetical protein